MTCHCRFNCNKCSTLVDVHNEGVHAYEGSGSIHGISVTFTQYLRAPKSVSKTNVYKKKKA